jgi:hypothetical protein
LNIIINAFNTIYRERTLKCKYTTIVVVVVVKWVPSAVVKWVTSAHLLHNISGAYAPILLVVVVVKWVASAVVEWVTSPHLLHNISGAYAPILVVVKWSHGVGTPSLHDQFIWPLESPNLPFMIGSFGLLESPKFLKQVTKLNSLQVTTSVGQLMSFDPGY